MRDLVHEVNSIDELNEFRPVWHHLLRDSRDASFVQTPEWLETFWEHFGANQKLRLLVMAQDGETAAIVPFVVMTADTSAGRLRYLTLPWTFLGIGHRPIGVNASYALTLAARHIRRTVRDWDIIDYRCIEANSADRGRVKNALALGGLNLNVRAWGEGSSIDFPNGGFEEYWNSRGTTLRDNVRRSEDALARTGDLAFTRYRPSVGRVESREPAVGSESSLRWDLFNACEEIDESAHSAQIGNGIIETNSLNLFQRDIHAIAARGGHADLTMLLINDQPVAFAYHFVHGKRVEAIRIGCRADVDTTHASALLVHQTLQDSFMRGDREYVNCTGSTSWLADWQTKQYAGYRYTYFSPKAPRAQLLRFNPWSTECVD
ncbi:MAG: GNAT family N-acetyltransferase [Planctomycetota bacterium]|nr:GNAT family N-acetyltransferase [Planctomycetota bacterium]